MLLLYLIKEAFHVANSLLWFTFAFKTLESLLTSTDATVSSSKEIVNSNKTSSMLSVNGSIKSSKGDLAAGVSRASGKAVSSSVVKQAKVNDESPRKRKRAKTSAVYHTKRKKRKASVESREMMISDSSTSATLSTRSKYTGDVNCNNKKPGLSTKARASSPQAENDNTDGAAIAAKPSFTDSDIKKLVNEVATVVANEIRNGSCWRFDGPIPQCIVVQSKVSRICVVKPAKILKSGSKLIDTRQSSDFGTGSSGNQNGSKQASQKKEACAAVAKENDGASEPLKSWIALAVERFVADVYFPHLIAAKSRMRSMPPTSDRIIISILLAIREMMTMNADRLFSSVHQVNVHAYAGAIVHVCAKKMSSIMSTFSVENFLSAIQGYDSRREDFRYSAVETDARAVCILPDGTKQSKEENIVARTSCNFTRSKHPLSFNKKILTKEDASNSLHKSYSSAAPCPNALAAMLMKPQDIKSDISKIDRACCSVTDQEKYLHFMSRTRSKKRQAYNKCIDRK